jgi:mRNA-degrading endonuclease RelE of RelBE toxin-antitoxin system
MTNIEIFIAKNPDAGDIIPGSNGLRKLRWGIPGKGKRGGTRLIYYWLKPRYTVLMLFIFKKNERSDITREQLKILKTIVARELL